MLLKIDNYSLYLVLTEQYGKGRSPVEVAKLAIKGGIDILQMREKDKSEEDLERLGKELLPLCRKSGVIFIVNDDPYLAHRLGADGVHLGQDDMERFPIDAVREIIGMDQLIGVSTQSIDQFEKANQSDVDYIAYGPIFHTLAKDDFIGTKDIKTVMNMARKPVVLIGGITLENMDEILNEGGENIAVIRDIMEADDIVKRTRLLKEKLNKYKKAGKV
jgi:thiamine-phosphate pyrophosphorylase